MKITIKKILEKLKPKITNLIKRAKLIIKKFKK
jgi:hypothetical protein